MTTERDDGHGPYVPIDKVYLGKLGQEEIGVCRMTLNLSRELLHLRERTATLESQIIEWKSASGLSDSSGDPDSIEPRHLARRIREDDSRHRLLLRKLDAERKVHASTALARDAAAAKVEVTERLEAWMDGSLPSEVARIEKGIDDIVVTLEWFDDDTHDTTDVSATGATVTDAIDAALREVEA